MKSFQQFNEVQRKIERDRIQALIKKDREEEELRRKRKSIQYNEYDIVYVGKSKFKYGIVEKQFVFGVNRGDVNVWNIEWISFDPTGDAGYPSLGYKWKDTWRTDGTDDTVGEPDDLRLIYRPKGNRHTDKKYLQLLKKHFKFIQK
ncbi:MAG: hypothetical protein H8D92_02360 [Pelagibacteraceae bacterium]|nr:hypothetical protein [Pelagibacteraceae bacterium]